MSFQETFIFSPNFLLTMHSHGSDSEEFAKHLTSEERKLWQDPERIADEIGLSGRAWVADLACGPGFFTLAFASRLDDGSLVYAVDSNKVMLEYLEKRLKALELKNGSLRNKVKIILSDVANTGIESSSVDVAFFANVFHDIQNKSVFLAEVKRICKDSALVIDIDWKAEETPFGPPAHMRIDEKEAINVIEENGFKLQRRTYGGEYHYCLIFVKR